MRRLSLDTGHLTDEELGVKRDLHRQMCELPTPRNKRVVITRNGNAITPVRR
jgi:hypothetical protein